MSIDEQAALRRPPKHRIIASGWLIGLLAFADPLWTLWRIPDDGNAVRLKIGMDQQHCETYRINLERVANLYVEIDQDVVHLREKPVGKRVHYRCRLDGEGPE